MIKAVLFDFDGVLTLAHSGTENTCANLSNASGIDKEVLLECYRQFKDLARGTLLHKDIWQQWCECIGKPMDISLLNDALRNIEKNEPMFELVQKLHSQYKVGVITDNSKERFELLSDSLDLNSKFDVLCNSGHIGSMKWENEIIFQFALDKLDLQADECIFIDNSQQNLEIPQKMGMRTIFYDDENDTVEILQEKLLQLGISIS